MKKQRFFRKIMIDHDKYGSVTLPKEAMDSFMASGCNHVEMNWDSESGILTLRAV